MPFVCGQHRAFVYPKGGRGDALAEITPLSAVRWQRVRDEVSTAQLNVPTHECCELLGDLRSILHEIHIERNGLKVWEGPITRIEYDFDEVRIYCEDLLWQSKRRVLEVGYDQSYPNIGNVIDRMDWLMHQCYDFDPMLGVADPWNVLATLHPIHGPDDPRTSRAVNAYQFYIWEDFDKYGEDSGADYTVVKRDIYYWDVNLAWKILDPLSDQNISQFPRVVEYGNQLATRGVVTNSSGYAGLGVAPAPWPATYGTVDWLVSNTEDANANTVPTPQEIDAWSDTAVKVVDDRAPAPLAVVIPANTTLLPGSTWLMEDLIPGAWFEADVTHLCRSVVEWQRIQEVVVTESAPQGELVQFTASTAPTTMVTP